MLFILLFSGYLALSMNMSRAHRVKNEIVDIIERESGLNTTSIKKIVNFLRKTGYASTGKCPDRDGGGGWLGLQSLADGTGFVSDNGSKYYICVKSVRSIDSNRITPWAYYRVKVFYNLDLPILGDLFKLGIASDSSKIFYPVENF